MNNQIDILTIGRSSIDLYSNDIGAAFEDITNFNAYVGGSSTNIAIGARRLGMNAALLTGVGNDKVGDFILSFLRKEGVITEYIPTIKSARSSAVLLGIEPPDRFPLVYYRDNAADWFISTQHVDQIDFSTVKTMVLSGTALAMEPSRTATLYAAQKAQQHQVQVALDLDFRADQWESPMDYSIYIKKLLPSVDYVIGTEEEVLASQWGNDSEMTISNQQISAPTVIGDKFAALQSITDSFSGILIVKRGAQGASIFRENDRTDIAGFSVKVLNVLGAGDAFAAGLFFGLDQNWSIEKSVRFANACGAILVTKPGCSNFSPTFDQVINFINEYGGF